MFCQVLRAVSAAGGKITLDEDVELEYDWLVLALGSQSSVAPGSANLAASFNTIQDALQVGA